MQVFPHVATGFSDTSAFLRELTLKSMLVLAPKVRPSQPSAWSTFAPWTKSLWMSFIFTDCAVLTVFFLKSVLNLSIALSGCVHSGLLKKKKILGLQISVVLFFQEDYCFFMTNSPICYCSYLSVRFQDLSWSIYLSSRWCSVLTEMPQMDSVWHVKVYNLVKSKKNHCYLCSGWWRTCDQDKHYNSSWKYCKLHEWWGMSFLLLSY